MDGVICEFQGERVGPLKQIHWRVSDIKYFAIDELRWAFEDRVNLLDEITYISVRALNSFAARVEIAALLQHAPELVRIARMSFTPDI